MPNRKVSDGCADKHGVAGTPKKAPLKRRRLARTSSPHAVGIVVRRGAKRRFKALEEKTAELPAVVLWDRRQTDRRGSPQPTEMDRRKTDRRHKPPYTWVVADFLVLDPPDPKADPER